MCSALPPAACRGVLYFALSLIPSDMKGEKKKLNKKIWISSQWKLCNRKYNHDSTKRISMKAEGDETKKKKKSNVCTVPDTVLNSNCLAQCNFSKY